jgi:hypothetical protein
MSVGDATVSGGTVVALHFRRGERSGFGYRRGAALAIMLYVDDNNQFLPGPVNYGIPDPTKPPPANNI